MLVVAAIALTVTPIFVVNAFRLLATDTFVRHEIDRGGFPPDRYGLTTPERQRLALIGLHSILPGGDGITLLEKATLPDGSPAFDTRELRHMRDVRSLLGAAYTAQLAALVAILALAIALHRSRRWRSVVPWGLLLGSLLTIGIAVLAVPVILLGFDGFFLRFHEIFFNGDTWRFSETDTLLRIYPETFWRDTAQLAAAIVVAQAVVVGLAARWWIFAPSARSTPRRRARRDRPPWPSRRRPAHRSSRRSDARSREHAPIVPVGGRRGRRSDRVRRARPEPRAARPRALRPPRGG